MANKAAKGRQGAFRIASLWLTFLGISTHTHTSSTSRWVHTPTWPRSQTRSSPTWVRSRRIYVLLVLMLALVLVWKCGQRDS